MNALQTDIQTIIRRSGPIRTADICEALEPLGYGGTMTNVSFREYISKTISRMKSEGHVIGEDRPNPGTKPVRYWALPEPVAEESLATEMASDIAEIVQAPEPETPETYRDTWTTKPAAEVEFKAAPENTAWKELLPSKPMSAAKILREFANLGFEDDRALGAYMDGIAAAERHHGIAE